jgi:rubrerythrin
MATALDSAAGAENTHTSPEAKLMGLVVFGEKTAARNYALMADLKPEFAVTLRKFASMEGQHSVWFRDASLRNGVQPNKEFADGELGYLVDQVNGYHANGDFDAIAVVQGFLVECLAIATYEPFLAIADRYEGGREVFQQALDDERYHVDWITRYLRLRFFDAEDEFMGLVERVNVQGIDCVGGTLMNIADCLKAVGLSAADCTGTMMDEYAGLLERVGFDSARATGNVVSLFVPLARKHRNREPATQVTG